MDAPFWDVLGIAATTDERAIKRAFATRLRTTSPESDAAGYMKLRDAFEAAKRHVTMQRHFNSTQVAPEVEEPEAIDVPQAPQQRAIADLRSLLSEKSLDDFLLKVGLIQSSQIFTTLDEQHDFIGEVARMVMEYDIEDAAWRGSLASLLGAREHDNIFSRNSRYWHPYQALLTSYGELRKAAAHAHAETRDDVTTTPGYLHVFHVLTAPFDAERLSALTRSRNYHRLAQDILERSKTDPAIVIPADNREWWERTAMAGQHRPIEDPVVTTYPAPARESSGIPAWAIWIGFVVLINMFRACGGL